jgi:DNA-binding MarR family transcriptional regulator
MSPIRFPIAPSAATTILHRVKHVNDGYAAAVTRTVDELAQRLNSATVHLMRALRQDRPASGLAAEHSSALGVVVFGGPISIGALARSERVGAPAMTKTVGILEAAGLVTRERDESDARVIRVRATRKGNELVLRGREDRVVRIGTALSTFSPAETARLNAAIGTFERLVRDLEAATVGGSGSTRSSRSPRAAAVGRTGSRARR